MKKSIRKKLAKIAAKLDEKNQFKLADEIDKIIALAARFPDIPDTAEQSQRDRLDKNLGDFFKDWPNKTPLSSKKRELDFKIYENQTQELDSWLNQNYSITKTEDEVSKTISYVFDNYNKSIVTFKIFPSSSLGSAVDDEWSTDDIKRKIKFSIGPEEKAKKAPSTQPPSTQPPSTQPLSTQPKSSSMYDFGNGPVPAHQHVNGSGWVADTASVDRSAYVGPDAVVFGNAGVYGKAIVTGNAGVSGNAKVYDDAQVYGNARVFGDAQVFGNAKVYDNAMVAGDAQVYGKAHVYDYALVAGDAYVFGNADITNQQIDTGDYQ